MQMYQYYIETIAHNVHALGAHHPIFALLIFVLGLLVGSFINVVAYRLPKIMYHEYGIKELNEPLSLSFPASHCVSCAQKISWYYNVPVLGWLFLQGACQHCKKPISLRYPIIELTTACISLFALYWFGFSFLLLCALVFIWALIALLLIDYDTQLLPDRITLPLAALGLLVNSQNMFATPTSAIYGLVFGFVSLYTVNKVFFWCTKKQGMGHGDFKLLAALGAWLGISSLPLIVLLAASVGMLVGFVLLYKNNGNSHAFAFGPFLVTAGILVLFFGYAIMEWYFNLVL